MYVARMVFEYVASHPVKQHGKNIEHNASIIAKHSTLMSLTRNCTINVAQDSGIYRNLMSSNDSMKI